MVRSAFPADGICSRSSSASNMEVLSFQIETPALPEPNSQRHPPNLDAKDRERKVPGKNTFGDVDLSDETTLNESFVKAY